jgi:major inositol transporter-like SP family MFS transporter
MLAVATVPAIALLVGMLALPDSPRWYALQGRLSDARNVLRLSRSPGEAEAEYAIVVDHTSHMLKSTSTPFSVIRDVPWIRRVVLVGCGLAIVQQATGINTVNYYAPTILEQSGLGVSAALVATIAVGVTSVVTTIIGIILLGYIGRRTMLQIGFAGVAASQAALAAAFLLPENTTRSYVILGCMVLFVGFVQMFIGTCVWLLLSEIFPLSVRGFAMGIAVFVLWCTNAVISFLFPLLNNALGSTGTFALFVLVNIGSWIFVHRLVPETKGTTLEELEERLETEGISASTMERTPV